jgi:hypothetical protein
MVQVFDKVQSGPKVVTVKVPIRVTKIGERLERLLEEHGVREKFLRKVNGNIEVNVSCDPGTLTEVFGVDMNQPMAWFDLFGKRVVLIGKTRPDKSATKTNATLFIGFDAKRKRPMCVFSNADDECMHISGTLGNQAPRPCGMMHSYTQRVKIQEFANELGKNKWNNLYDASTAFNEKWVKEFAKSSARHDGWNVVSKRKNVGKKVLVPRSSSAPWSKPAKKVEPKPAKEEPKPVEEAVQCDVVVAVKATEMVNGHVHSQMLRVRQPDGSELQILCNVMIHMVDDDVEDL